MNLRSLKTNRSAEGANFTMCHFGCLTESDALASDFGNLMAGTRLPSR